MTYVLDWFYLVNPTGYGWGPVKVSHMEIEAFSRTRKLDLRPWEVELIVDLSIKFVEVWGTKQKQGNSLPAGYKPVSLTDNDSLKVLFGQASRKKGGIESGSS